MTDEPNGLDDHHDTSAQKATEARRPRLHETQADQAVLQRRQEQLKKTSPNRSARHLAGGGGLGTVSIVQLFAAAPEAKIRAPRNSSRMRSRI